MGFCVLGLARPAVAAGEPVSRDALVYKDGDRIQGKFIERTNDVIVFKSDRFGELRVAATDAVVLMGDKALAPGKKVLPEFQVASAAAQRRETRDHQHGSSI